MVGVGIIGVGFVGRIHFNSWLKLPERAQLVALCDTEPDRRAGKIDNVVGNLEIKATSQPTGQSFKSYADYRELLAAPEVNVVDICLPTYLHAEVAIAALQAGKHVLCEKPMALNLEQCDRMLEAAVKAKGRFMIAQCVRFWPEYRYLKEIVDDQRFGPLKSLHLRRQAFLPLYTMANWLMDESIAGGMVMDLHVHDTDYVRHLLGQPDSVHAVGIDTPGRGVDHIYSFWQYPSNIPVLVEGYWDMPPGHGFNMGFSALFEQAGVTWDCATGKPLTVFLPNGSSETPEMPSNDGYSNEIAYFLDCIEQGRPPQVSTPQQSRDAVAIALAESESVRTGKTVKINWRD
ncbi:MAG: Gfo/Idh/MocA family oxidoreductase [Phycisphaerales bacterium]|nr:Gfo/Idh/MocA family oxidoreductase [Phycisphaerales bacterium]